MKKMKANPRTNVVSNFISRYNEIRHTTERVCKGIERFAQYFPSVALDASRIQARMLLYYQFLQLYFNSPQNLAKKR